MQAGKWWRVRPAILSDGGNQQNALSLIQKAESLGAVDMDSQVYKARVLELLGRRDEALATLADCFRKGATALQIAPYPDLHSLRKDPRYRQMLQPKSATKTHQ